MSETLFKTTFGVEPQMTVFTPGRVNILGEHIDYNGGLVLPSALNVGITLSLSPRSDARVRVVADGFDGLAERNIGDTVQDHWSDYIVGAMAIGRNAGLTEHGADVAVTSALPFGAGISSSAAVTVALLSALNDLSSRGLSRPEIAVLARRVENDFIGVPCGIMDQMAVAVAQPGQALALDTKTLDYELIDLPGDHRFVVVYSGVRRELADGAYAQRKAECDEAALRLGVAHLCLISEQQLSKLADAPAIHRRARHCLREHRRTLTAAKALRDGDLSFLGELLNEGHASIRDDFEITVPAVDHLVEDAVELGALGARQTGGGFGGCIVALVEADAVKSWFAQLQERHPAIRLIA